MFSRFFYPVAKLINTDFCDADCACLPLSLQSTDAQTSHLSRYSCRLSRGQSQSYF